MLYTCISMHCFSVLTSYDQNFLELKSCLISFFLSAPLYLKCDGKLKSGLTCQALAGQIKSVLLPKSAFSQSVFTEKKDRSWWAFSTKLGLCLERYMHLTKMNGLLATRFLKTLWTSCFALFSSGQGWVEKHILPFL